MSQPQIEFAEAEADDRSSLTVPADGALTLADRSLSLWLDGRLRHFHYVWLRDNSWAPADRVVQSSERKLFTPEIPPTIAPLAATFDSDAGLEVHWNDGQRSRYATDWLRRHDYSGEPRATRRHQVTLWGAERFEVPRVAYDDVIATTDGQLAYLDAVIAFGAAVVTGVPSADRQVERFAERIGHVREVAFERVHNVRHDPDGYNVAHTCDELKPHTDLPSYDWPPSIQLLHFLTNQATGGESTLVDGWSALAELRSESPEHFETLCRTPVPYQLFSHDEDTWAENPMVQLDTDGNVKVFRFSNQLAQPLSIPFEQVEAFYAAYRRLGAIVDSGRHRWTSRSDGGDLLTVHSHRVLHGRLPFDPASGERHLQDVYMEFDDFLARRRVLRGVHRPVPAERPGHTQEAA